MAKVASFVSSLKAKYQHLSLAMPAKGEPGFNTDVLLFQRWASRVGKGWYGFALNPAPNSWATIINEFLEWMEKQDPNFVIFQNKLKFGGCRAYLGFSITDEEKLKELHAEIAELESWLFHKSLIY